MAFVAALRNRVFQGAVWVEEIPSILFNYLKHTAIHSHSGQPTCDCHYCKPQYVTAFQAQGTRVPSEVQVTEL